MFTLTYLSPKYVKNFKNIFKWNLIKKLFIFITQEPAAVEEVQKYLRKFIRITHIMHIYSYF